MMTIFFYIYVFMIPLEIYLDRIPKGPTGINYGNITMMLLVTWWLVRRPMRGKSVVMNTPLNIPIILFIVWYYFGMIQTMMSIKEAPSAFDPMSDNFKLFMQFYNALLLYFVAAHMMDSHKKIIGVLAAIALASIPVFRAFRSDLLSVMSWHYTDNLRVKGPFIWVGSNELGAFFAYGALFLGLFGFYFKRWIGKGLFFFAGALYCYGVLYSYSRGTQLAFLGGAALIPLLRYRTTVLPVILLVATSQVWLPTSVVDRWAMTTDENGQLESSAQSRKDFSALAWQLFLKSPVIGNGTGSFRLLNPVKMDTHNHYMRTLAEGGLVGIGLLAAVWGGILRLSYKLWRKGLSAFDRHYGFCLMVTTTGLMIANIFGDRFSHLPMIGQYWVLVGMGARLYAAMVGEEGLRETAAAATDPAATAPAVDAEDPSSMTPPVRTRRRNPVLTNLAPLNPGVMMHPAGAGGPQLNLLGQTELALKIKLAGEIDSIMKQSEDQVMNNLTPQSQGMNLVYPRGERSLV